MAKNINDDMTNNPEYESPAHSEQYRASMNPLIDRIKITSDSATNARIKRFADHVGLEVGRMVSTLIIEGIAIILAEESAGWKLEMVEKKSERSSPVPNKLLTPHEVAQFLDISSSKAYYMIQTGDIPVVRIGRNVRVRQQDLEEFIRNNLVRGR